MTQHVMLLTVAAPLIVLGAPWSSIWRPLPLGFRRTVAKTISRSSWCAPLRALGRLLARPIPVWIAFNVNLVAWHVPAAYDLAVRNRAVHDLEHVTFLLFGVLLWAQVLDSPPLRARLSAIHRVYYIVASAIVGWIIALVLIFASSPLYPAYAHLAHRPGGISALTDQQLAGGVMLGARLARDDPLRLHPALRVDGHRRGTGAPSRRSQDPLSELPPAAQRRRRSSSHDNTDACSAPASAPRRGVRFWHAPPALSTTAVHFAWQRPMLGSTCARHRPPRGRVTDTLSTSTSHR